MRISFKLLSVVLVIVLTLTGLSVFGVSAEATYTQPEKFIYGDVDMDGVVTVKDATLIQKYIVGIEYLTGVQKFLADPYEAGLSIKNATAIQKRVAGHQMVTTFYFGQEVDMTSQDEFSKYVSIDDEFTNDCIIVSQKEYIDGIYELADFPEYDFESIELIGEPTYDSIRFYILKLKNPGKENVIEAIKALDYRANLDLLFASANHIWHLD